VFKLGDIMCDSINSKNAAQRLFQIYYMTRMGTEFKEDDDYVMRMGMELKENDDHAMFEENCDNRCDQLKNMTVARSQTFESFAKNVSCDTMAREIGRAFAVDLSCVDGLPPMCHDWKWRIPRFVTSLFWSAIFGLSCMGFFKMWELTMVEIQNTWPYCKWVFRQKRLEIKLVRIQLARKKRHRVIQQVVPATTHIIPPIAAIIASYE
jgi:hypothetical protein